MQKKPLRLKSGRFSLDNSFTTVRFDAEKQRKDYMNADKMVRIWNSTSDRSLVKMMEIDEWKEIATDTLLDRHPTSDTLARALKKLGSSDLRGRFVAAYETEMLSRTLSPVEVRMFLECSEVLSDGALRALQHQLFGPAATIDEIISLTNDPDPTWREKAVAEVLRRRGELSYKQWTDGLLQCWGNENHADVAVRVWKAFREKYPTLDFDELFSVAQWCPHVQGFVFREYLMRKPHHIASSARDAHLLYCAATKVLGEPAYGGALWVREDLSENQQKRLRKKAIEFVRYAEKLEKEARNT